MNDEIFAYGKPNFRASMTALSFAQKVDQVISLQERLAPIYAQRGILMVPWPSDGDSVMISERKDEQSAFMDKLRSLTQEAKVDADEAAEAGMAFQSAFATSTIAVGEAVYAN